MFVSYFKLPTFQLFSQTPFLWFGSIWLEAFLTKLSQKIRKVELLSCFLSDKCNVAAMEGSGLAFLFLLNICLLLNLLDCWDSDGLERFNLQPFVALSELLI